VIPLSTKPRAYPRLARGPLFLGEVRIARPAKLGQGVNPNAQMDPVTNLAVNGAILQVQVSVPAAYQQAGGAAAAPQTFTAMIDSGASISCINIGAAQQMGLQQVSSTQLGGVGGSSEAPIYAAALTLLQYNVTVDPVQIAGVSNPLPGVDMLIGRDILRQLDFDYQGSAGSFTITQTTPPPTTQNQVAAAPPTPGTVAAPQGAQPQQGLPQPPPATTILGMPPLVAAGVGAAGVGLVIGGLFLFDVF
jgi:hypothetical protein